MGRELQEVFFVDGVRTAFGRAGAKGVFSRTRADDMAVKVTRELLRRNPQIEPDRIGDVIFAATAQVGDQGLTLGRDVALLAGIPQSVPGFAVDRMCAGSLTAVTAGAGEIAMGAADVVLAGGVEHMGHHPIDRFCLSPTLRNYAEGRDEIVVAEERRGSVEEITESVLEELADELRHLLEDGVVPEAADVDTCLLLGAGFPLFLGGITKHLDETGVSERVCGRPLAGVGAAARA